MDQLHELLVITLGAILANNFIFSQFLGICPFLGVSKKVDTAVGMGIAVTFVMGLASAITWVVNKFILVRFGLMYMQTVAFILVIASLVLPVYGLGRVPAFDYDELRGFGRGAAEYSERLRLHFLRGVRRDGRHRLPAGDCVVCQHPGASGVCGLSQEL